MAAILILGRKHRNTLEAPPSKAENERVVALEDLFVPAVLLESAAEESLVGLLWRETTEDHGHDRVERLEKLDRNSIDTDTNVQPLTEAFVTKTSSLTLFSKFFLVAPKTSFLFPQQCLNAFAFGLLIVLGPVARFLIFIVFIIKILLLGRLLLGVEFAKLLVGHASRCTIAIIVIFIVRLKDFPIGTKLFARLKILKVTDFLVVISSTASYATSTVGIIPFAGDELVSQSLKEAVLSVVKPNGHVEIVGDIVRVSSLRFLKSRRILFSESI